MNDVGWAAPGPVAQAFFEDITTSMPVLMGPVAGGKTVTGLQKGLVTGYQWPQTPGRPGLREAKFGVIRRLWKDLEATTMKSWFNWFPRSMGTWLGDPPTHTLLLPHPDGSQLELTTQFMAFGDLRIEEALRGFEPSFCYVDEVDLAPENALTFLLTRAARFPSGVLPFAPKQVWGTCNAPEEDSWVVRDYIDDVKPGCHLYRQPSGLSSQAENLDVVGRGYYQEMAATMPAFERRRFVENVPGLSRGADAVYSEFNPDLHIAPAPLPVLDRPVIVGMDAGGTPAAGFWQRRANGQWRKLAELSTHAKEHGSITGPNRFGEAMAELLAEKFRGLKVHGLADPSAAYGADSANGEASWIDTVARVARIPVRPAPGNNDPSVRMEALRLPMGKLIDGREPAVLICPSCKLTTRAYGRDYRWQVTAGRRTGILKNWASHLVEADQYALLDGGAFHEVMARGKQRAQAFAPAVAQTDFNPFSTRG
jgi:hypothetical protein